MARVFSRDARRDSRTPETAAELFSAFSRKAEKRSTFSGARSSVIRLAVVSMLVTMSSAFSPRPAARGDLAVGLEVFGGQGAAADLDVFLPGQADVGHERRSCPS
ncbi:MAG: hypothetical protein MZV64_12550 [Ignavibacteriales bacterium]|nr:hypothetical protein [Ignavibacteriales bacterium]